MNLLERLTHMYMDIKTRFQNMLAWMKLKRKPLLIGGAVLLVGIFVIAASGGDAVVTETYIVARQEVSLDVILAGRTESGSQVDLGFADNGRVSSVTVKEGDRVVQGSVLATLELGDLYADLRDAEANVRIAESEQSAGGTNLEKITAEQDTLVANAKKTLLSSDLEAVSENISTTATAPEIVGDYTGGEGEYRIHVYSSGATSGYSFEISGIENNSTEDVATDQAVPLGTKGLYVRFQDAAGYGNTDWVVSIPNKRASSYTTNYNAYLSARSTRDRVIAAAKEDLLEEGGQASVLAARVEQARARVANIQARIAKRMIIAPFSGVVANVKAKIGETSSADSTVTLISDADYQITAKAAEIDVAKLSVGQTAKIALDAYPGEIFSGTVASINPAETIVDGVPVYEATILFQARDPRIRSGMTATVSVTAANAGTVIAVPERLVEKKNGESAVYIKAGETTERRIVILGLSGSAGFVEVTNGLAEGDIVTSR